MSNREEKPEGEDEGQRVRRTRPPSDTAAYVGAMLAGHPSADTETALLGAVGASPLSRGFERHFVASTSLKELQGTACSSSLCPSQPARRNPCHSLFHPRRQRHQPMLSISSLHSSMSHSRSLSVCNQHCSIESVAPSRASQRYRVQKVLQFGLHGTALLRDSVETVLYTRRDGRESRISSR
jgi:hypothetical protein